MKPNIKQLLDSFVHDNEETIIEHGYNVAEYILNDTESQDNGWLWFLTDEEIEKFEKFEQFGPERQMFVNEITAFVNKNYNYNINKKYILQDCEAGNIIDEFNTIEEAKDGLNRYEAGDRKNSCFVPDFYEIKEVKKNE